MVEPAGLWELDDLTEFRRFDFPRLGGILAERKMRTRNVVVMEVIAQNPSHVPFAEDDYVVEAFTPNRSMTRSTYGFCHGERGAMRTGLIPRALTRRVKSWP